MPKSRPPRKAYRGSRSGRDLSSGRLNVQSSTPAGQQTPHRAVPSQSTSLGGASGPGSGTPPTRSVPAGPGHLRGTNRRPILIAAGVAAAAGGGGLVYDARRRKRARVSKLYNPFTGQTVEVGKADDQHSSTGRKVTAAAFPGYHAAFAGRRGKKLRASGREVAESTAGALPGVAGMMAAAHRGSLRGVMAGNAATQIGSRGAAVHANNVNQRKGYLKSEVGKSFPVAVPVPSSTRVSPVVPRGRHVSTENDLSVTTHRTRRKGSPSALANYHSGSDTRNTGGGQSFGHSARKVSKAYENSQGASVRGSRGTPMSGIAQAGRVGHRLAIV